MFSLAFAMVPRVGGLVSRHSCRPVARRSGSALTASADAPTVVDPRRFSLAPMMEYTDRHLRCLMRLISANMTLYTEMVTAPTIVHRAPDGLDRWLRMSDPLPVHRDASGAGSDDGRALGEHRDEHPVVLQLGGSDPTLLHDACQLAVPYGSVAWRVGSVGCGSFGRLVCSAAATGTREQSARTHNTPYGGAL